MQNFQVNYDNSESIRRWSLLLTDHMTPKTRIIVYAIKTSNKEILVDSMELYVESVKNKVSQTLFAVVFIVFQRPLS